MTADLLFRAFLKVYLFKEMLFSDRKAFLNYVLSNSLASQQFLALPSFAKMTVSCLGEEGVEIYGCRAKSLYNSIIME